MKNTTTYNQNKKFALQKLLSKWPKNAIYVSTWLAQNGYSRELIHKYIKSKWLKSPSKSAFLRYQDELTWQGAIWALQAQLNLLIHVGEKAR